MEQALEEKKRKLASAEQRCKEYAPRIRDLEARRDKVHNRRQDIRRRDDELSQRRKALLDSIRKLESKVWLDAQRSTPLSVNFSSLQMISSSNGGLKLQAGEDGKCRLTHAQA